MSALPEAPLTLESISEFLKSEDAHANQDFYWERHRFDRHGYLKITHLVDPRVRMLMMDEARALLKSHAKRRDMLIESTGFTPRYLSNVPRDIINEHGKVIPAVYHSNYIKKLLQAITKDEIIGIPWIGDEFIINSQHKAGDTHGWHWGDYPYTIIWVVQATPINTGGLLECVPHTNWDKKNPRIQEVLIENNIESHFHKTGDVYLLKTDTTLHRVTPLNEDVERIILNTAFERARDKDRHVEHETFSFRD
jgi:hypothetical protein